MRPRFLSSKFIFQAYMEAEFSEKICVNYERDSWYIDSPLNCKYGDHAILVAGQCIPIAILENFCGGVFVWGGMAMVNVNWRATELHVYNYLKHRGSGGGSDGTRV